MQIDVKITVFNDRQDYIYRVHFTHPGNSIDMGTQQTPVPFISPGGSYTFDLHFQSGLLDSGRDIWGGRSFDRFAISAFYTGPYVFSPRVTIDPDDYVWFPASTP